MTPVQQLVDALDSEIKRLSHGRDLVGDVDDEIAAKSVHVFGDALAAARWLITPSKLFDGRAPAAHGRTDVGKAEVLRVLGRIEDGNPL